MDITYFYKANTSQMLKSRCKNIIINCQSKVNLIFFLLIFNNAQTKNHPGSCNDADDDDFNRNILEIKESPQKSFIPLSICLSKEGKSFIDSLNVC